MVYIVSCLINNAVNKKNYLYKSDSLDDLWMKLILTPSNYGIYGLNNKITRDLMSKIKFEHRGKE